MAIFKPDVPRIAINAEHQRLMWLNFSPTLVIVLLILYGFFCFIGFDSFTFVRNPEEFYSHIAMVGYFGYGFSLMALFILLRNSIQADLKSQFWDQLRMSSLSAWQMTWTRLFSAPIMAWFSLIIASVLVIAGAYLGSPKDMIFSPVITFSFYILSAVFFACIVLINCLQFGRSQKEWQGSLLQVVLLYFVITLCIKSLPKTVHVKIGNPLGLFNENVSLDALIGFAIILVLYFGLGAWHSMSYKLHLKSSNAYWLIATIILPFILTFYSLLWSGEFLPLLFYMSAIYFSAVILSLSLQDNRLSTYQIALTYIEQGQWKKALLKLPIWVHFFAICLFLTPIYMLWLPDEIWDYLESLFMLLVYIFAILCAVQVSRRFNAITIAMIGFLIFRSSLFLFV